MKNFSLAEVVPALLVAIGVLVGVGAYFLVDHLNAPILPVADSTPRSLLLTDSSGQPADPRCTFDIAEYALEATDPYLVNFDTCTKAGRISEVRADDGVYSALYEDTGGMTSTQQAQYRVLGSKGNTLLVKASLERLEEYQTVFSANEVSPGVYEIQWVLDERSDGFISNVYMAEGRGIVWRGATEELYSPYSHSSLASDLYIDGIYSGSAVDVEVWKEELPQKVCIRDVFASAPTFMSPDEMAEVRNKAREACMNSFAE